MDAIDVRSDGGFTLIEVMIATAIFVFVAVAGFETVRQFGTAVVLLDQRSAAAAGLATALGRLRSDAASSAAVWLPASACGSAVSMMRRDASGTSFTTYVVRAGALVRATAAGPINPCDAALDVDTVLGNVTAVTASALPANALPSHVDPISGNADGGLFRGVPVISVSAHALDYDGTPIASGNGIVEVNVDADPAEATVDLIAGNRPNAYTAVLAYVCGDRCAANAIFPEVASLDVATCAANAPDLPDSSASYVAAATGVGGAGRIVTTAYAVHLRYGFTFGGASSPPVTAYRTGPTFTWPATANLADPYPVDYAHNTLRSTGAAALAALFGPPADLTTESSVCAGIANEALFHG